MLLKKLVSILCCLSLLLISLASCKKDDDTPRVKEPETQYTIVWDLFDTKSIIYSYKGDSEAEFKSNCKDVETLLREYHKLFDIYYKYSGINNLKTVNDNAGVAPVEVDEKLIDFLLYAKEIYTLTGGMTNVAMGSVLKLWHDCREDASDEDHPVYRIPSSEALAEASEHCSIDDLIIDKEAGTVYLADPDMRLDVGALGKGYATEKAAQLLISRGVSSYVLNIGGNIRIIGEKVTGEGWVTGITNPDKSSDESIFTKINIKNTSLVTSGNYERFYTVDGVNYHHIIDPDTLMPANYFSSISIIAQNSALADALSTALFCMTYEEGLALVNSIGGIEVIWVDLEYNVKHTSGISFVN